MPTDIQGSQIFASPAHKPRIAKEDRIGQHKWETSRGQRSKDHCDIIIRKNNSTMVCVVFNSKIGVFRHIAMKHHLSIHRDPFAFHRWFLRSHLHSHTHTHTHDIVMCTINHFKSSTRNVPMQGLFGSSQMSLCKLNIHKGNWYSGKDKKEKKRKESQWATGILDKDLQPNKLYESYLLRVTESLL